MLQKEYGQTNTFYENHAYDRNNTGYVNVGSFQQ